MPDDANKQMSAAEAMARRDIHGSTLRDMTQVDFDPMADRAAFNFGIGGPSPMIPRKSTVETAPPLPANTSGWQAEIPISSPPGVGLIDQMCINADAQERLQQAQPTDMMRMMQACMAMMRLQTTTVQALAALIMRNDDKPDKPKRRRKSKQPSAEGEA